MTLAEKHIFCQKVGCAEKMYVAKMFDVWHKKSKADTVLCVMDKIYDIYFNKKHPKKSLIFVRMGPRGRMQVGCNLLTTLVSPRWIIFPHFVGKPTLQIFKILRDICGPHGTKDRIPFSGITNDV